MKIFAKTLLPSVYAFCLPFLGQAASAGNVSVPDGESTWVMSITPSRSVTAASSASEVIRVAAYEPLDGPMVPLPADAVVPELNPAPNVADEPAETADEPAKLAEKGNGEPAKAGDEADSAEVPGSYAAACGPMRMTRAQYWEVYQSVPFIRTEYLANPSYRHEATMELLFGQMRPTVIQKQQGGAVHQPPRPAAPAIPPYIWNPVLGGQIPSFVFRYGPRTVPLPYTRSLGR